jgi:hypothetical protein
VLVLKCCCSVEWRYNASVVVVMYFCEEREQEAEGDGE